LISYDKNQFDLNIIKVAFETASSINSQSLTLDFIYDKNNNTKIVELSYAFVQGPVYDNCPGYWDENLKWHDEPVNPQYFIIEDFIESIQEKQNQWKFSSLLNLFVLEVRSEDSLN